ncbi:hypothetical protein IC575_002397 [Cucumis melo]
MFQITSFDYFIYTCLCNPRLLLISYGFLSFWIFSFFSVSEEEDPRFVGIFSGIVVLLTTRGKSSRILEFNEQLFFIYLLPTIIFNAG